jgi:hypothetical protein
MEHSLPAEPNLKEALAGNLSQAAHAACDRDSARKYLFSQLRAHEENLWNGFLARSGWYKEHYPGASRLSALAELIFSKITGMFFGYGESWIRILIFLLVFSAVVFPLAYFFASSAEFVGHRWLR